ncbi:RluA family pseudouridine synthase [Zavarzinia sp. CC-PAN008]|uniref:RluA family pseudouridine synthase n=1 Tax=Zavarzinia sp. CC-PAN008 TaxID=3243332 RepID=UPI003F74AABE
MSAVETVIVAEGEAGQRLDRWFKRRFPELTHGRLEKLLRTGQIRVEGGRVKADRRLEAGESVRVPPLGLPADMAPKERPSVDAATTRMVQSLVIHRDKSVLVLNKPPGLAVQGGSGVGRHLDGMLDALTFDAAERPRLVHRLDRDTSGVIVLGRTLKATAALAEAFKGREARKIYWALVAGVPRPLQGTINLALAKGGPVGREKMRPDADEARDAVTDYAAMELAAPRASWLALSPRTGRTHQIRAHAVVLGTPIVGDVKYGRARAILPGVSEQLHLHARWLSLPHPDGGTLTVKAPLPPHMLESWRLFGFDPEWKENPFTELWASERAG